MSQPLTNFVELHRCSGYVEDGYEMGPSVWVNPAAIYYVESAEGEHCRVHMVSDPDRTLFIWEPAPSVVHNLLGVPDVQPPPA